MIINNCIFKDNYAEDYGGAIYTNNVYVNYNQAVHQSFNTFFINNKAGDGWSHLCDKNVNSINTLFSGNKANVDIVAIYACNNVKIDHCLFESNRAEGTEVRAYI